MTKSLKQKSDLINKIMMCVNASHVIKGTRKADGEMFLKLAFMSNKELKELCKKAGIN